MVQLPILTNFYPKKGHLEFSGAYFLVVSLAAVFSIVTQRSSSLWGGALRDDTKNGCEGD